MTFNVWTFVFEIVNFVVLAAILYRLLYRPLREAIAQRQADNDRVRAEAEAARKVAEAAQIQLTAQLGDIEKQRQEVLRKAGEAADAEKARRLAEAEAAAAAVLEKSRRDAEQLHRDALASLESEVAGLAVGLADRLLGQAAGTTLNSQLTQRLVESLEATSEDERARLRQTNGNEPTLVQSARAIDDALQCRITTAVQKLLDRNSEVRFEVSPDCVCGSRLQFGGHVWDATLGGALEHARSQLLGGGHERA